MIFLSCIIFVLFCYSYFCHRILCWFPILNFILLKNFAHTLKKVRISSKPEGQGAKGIAWHHANCFIELNPLVQEEKLSGLQNLSTSDQEAVHALLKKTASTAKSGTA